MGPPDSRSGDQSAIKPDQSPTRPENRPEDRSANGPDGGPDGRPDRPHTPLGITPAVKRALLDAHALARAEGVGYIGPEHVLSALAANPDSAAGHILNAARFSPSPARPRARPRRQAPRAPRAGAFLPTPTLDKYGRDLTDLARQGRIDPVIGRDTEIEQTVEVLSRRGKNNPVLIGDAGVGKTAIVEGLAERIADGDVPDVLMRPPRRRPGPVGRGRGHALSR